MESCKIVVLGGPAAGKTVYLASLYHHLWQGRDGLSMRAAAGSMHTELLATAKQIQAGTMPPATQALRHFEFELHHFGKVYSLRFLDYPGELFRKVFYDTVVDSAEARELYEVSISADGIIALVDPASILDGSWDIDYALTNLLRFYKTEGRKAPKLLIAFTKRDKTEVLVGSRVSYFVREHLPHLALELGDGMRLQHFCSITQTNGTVAFANPETVTAPLRSVVEAIETEQTRHNRDAYMRRIAWKRAITTCFLVILAALTAFGAFVLGIVCRKS